MKTKQLLLMLLLFSLPFGVYCQLEKGSYLGSASAGLSFQHSNFPSGDTRAKSSSIDFSLNNSFGIFVTDRLAIGPGFDISTGYYSSRYENNSIVETKIHTTFYSLFLDPFARFYFFHHGKVAFFGQITGIIGYDQNFENYKAGNSDEQKNTSSNLTYGGGLAVGFVYFISQNIGVETALGYQLIGFESKNENFKDYRTSGELAIHAGFSFYIGKCKKKDEHTSATP